MQAHSILDRRRAGILLHITSLPGGYGNGDLGQDAYRFVDFLVNCGISVWQTLPVNPTHADGSPYQCLSAHAGNPLMINLDWLVERGWLDQQTRDRCEGTPLEYRSQCLGFAFDGFTQSDAVNSTEYQDFIRQHQAGWRASPCSWPYVETLPARGGRIGPSICVIAELRPSRQPKRGWPVASGR
jgi:4-alpha-glucanotransferase